MGFTIYDLTIYDLLFITYHSLFITTYYLLLTTYYSLLTPSNHSKRILNFLKLTAISSIAIAAKIPISVNTNETSTP